MKLYLENVSKSSPNDLFQLKEEFFAFNDFPLHYHPEYELIYIIKSEGRRYIGNNIGTFQSGDIYLLGPNLPHTFYNKDFSSDNEVHQIVLQFREDFLAPNLFEKPTFHSIRSLLANSGQGLYISGENGKQAGEILRKMVKMDPSEAAISLLYLLDHLTKLPDLQILSTPSLAHEYSLRDSNRMGLVHQYLLENFRKHIDLTHAASIACLSTSAFCRYFKKYTRKTFSEFVIDLRINYACELIKQNSLSMAQISLDSGFNNSSYFNRKFKKVVKMTPQEYYKQCFPLIAKKVPENRR
ncbi:AraC family transcriptional regulator [Pedobacter psychroterrae]|uniref:AraC family transcriptional regulator n=1 Tax=Pedobacter psychroterrae TaxID=2530453 RepID=A0A4R0NCT5_9SPHI|nr:AraC family transcriptional regulator [Pedobacter psychroterrae]TCC96872.1 AraC family transcriptional regulator [Pedobacter psychroterrae]